MLIAGTKPGDRWYRERLLLRPFLPRCFKDENRIQSIKGIYVPFFLFDYTASGISDFIRK